MYAMPLNIFDRFSYQNKKIVLNTNKKSKTGQEQI